GEFWGGIFHTHPDERSIDSFSFTDVIGMFNSDERFSLVRTATSYHAMVAADRRQQAGNRAVTAGLRFIADKLFENCMTSECYQRIPHQLGDALGSSFYSGSVDGKLRLEPRTPVSIFHLIVRERLKPVPLSEDRVTIPLEPR